MSRSRSLISARLKRDADCDIMRGLECLQGFVGQFARSLRCLFGGFQLPGADHLISREVEALCDDQKFTGRA
jgi:hypothetical protein